MKTKRMLIVFSLCGVMMTGCVTNKKYQQLQADYLSTRESLIKCEANGDNLQQRLEAAESNNRELRAGLAELKSTLDKSMDQNAQGNVNIAKLVDEINASNKYIKQLVDAKSKSDSLNIALTNKLTRSLSTDELKDVDVKVLKGVVYISLADNMLFKTGSYEVNNRAMETLSKIAKIIKDYSSYDVLVEGIPTMCLSAAPTSATTGICRHCVPRQWFRCYRMISASTRSVCQPPAVANITPSPTTTVNLAVSATAAPRLSSLQNSTSSLT